MSNLGQQFDPATEARHIQNNKSRLTRTLKASLGEFAAPQRRYLSKSKGGRAWLKSAGVVYTPIDSNNTLVHYSLATGTRPSEHSEMLNSYHERIFGALKDAGYNVSMSGDKIHVKH